MITIEPAQPIALTIASLPFLMAAFQGGLLVLALVFKSNEPDHGTGARWARYLFSGLLLILSLMLLEHAVDISGYFYQAPALIDIIAPSYLMIGPLLYGYILIQTSPTPPKFHYRPLLHCLPALIHLLVSLPFILSTDCNPPRK